MALCVTASLDVNSPTLGVAIAIDAPDNTMTLAQPSNTLTLDQPSSSLAVKQPISTLVLCPPAHVPIAYTSGFSSGYN